MRISVRGATVLTVNGARAGYGDGPNVLTDISIEVNSGEIVALVGLNGAGKSTLVKVVGGLIPIREGEVTFLEEDISERAIASICCSPPLNVPAA